MSDLCWLCRICFNNSDACLKPPPPPHTHTHTMSLSPRRLLLWLSMRQQLVWDYCRSGVWFVTPAQSHCLIQYYKWLSIRVDDCLLCPNTLINNRQLHQFPAAVSLRSDDHCQRALHTSACAWQLVIFWRYLTGWRPDCHIDWQIVFCMCLRHNSGACIFANFLHAFSWCAAGVCAGPKINTHWVSKKIQVKNSMVSLWNSVIKLI